MSYDDYKHKIDVKKMEKLIKQNRAQMTVDNAKNKRKYSDYDKKLGKFLREEQKHHS